MIAIFASGWLKLDYWENKKEITMNSVGGRFNRLERSDLVGAQDEECEF